MSDKIIPIDTTKRINKKDYDKLLNKLDSLDPEKLESVVVIYKLDDRTPGLYAYGLTWAAIGAAQTMLTTLGQDMLRDQFRDD